MGCLGLALDLSPWLTPSDGTLLCSVPQETPAHADLKLLFGSVVWEGKELGFEHYGVPQGRWGVSGEGWAFGNSFLG